MERSLLLGAPYFINQIEEYTKKSGGSLASVIGRYYSLDRDHRWDRTKNAYDLLINNIGLKTQNIIETITDFYNNGITDEFIEPIVITDNNNNPISKIDDNDVIVFFNYRSDRGRQLTSLICEKNNNQLDSKSLNVKFYTLTNYDNSFENVIPIFYNENLKNTLGEILSKNNKSKDDISEKKYEGMIARNIEVIKSSHKEKTWKYIAAFTGISFVSNILKGNIAAALLKLTSFV